MTVEMPRVDDRRIDENGERCQFMSKIVPPYLRRTKAMEEFLPWLYLKGISTGDMTETLEGPRGAAGLGSVGDHHRSPQRAMARRMAGLVEAIVGGSMLCLSLGGRGVFQRPAGG